MYTDVAMAVMVAESDDMPKICHHLLLLYYFHISCIFVVVLRLVMNGRVP